MENEKFQELILKQFAILSQEIQEVRTGQQITEQKVDGLGVLVEKVDSLGVLAEKVDGLGVLMEKVDNNVKAVAEGLSAHREHNDRQFSELRDSIKEENELLKSVLKHSSSEICYTFL